MGRVGPRPIQTLALLAAASSGSGHCHSLPMSLSTMNSVGPLFLGPSSGSVHPSPCEEGYFPTERSMTRVRHTAHLHGFLYCHYHPLPLLAMIVDWSHCSDPLFRVTAPRHSHDWCAFAERHASNLRSAPTTSHSSTICPYASPTLSATLRLWESPRVSHPSSQRRRRFPVDSSCSAPTRLHGNQYVLVDASSFPPLLQQTCLNAAEAVPSPGHGEAASTDLSVGSGSAEVCDALLGAMSDASRDIFDPSVLRHLSRLLGLAHTKSATINGMKAALDRLGAAGSFTHDQGHVDKHGASPATFRKYLKTFRDLLEWCRREASGSGAAEVPPATAQADGEGSAIPRVGDTSCYTGHLPASESTVGNFSLFRPMAPILVNP